MSEPTKAELLAEEAFHVASSSVEQAETTLKAARFAKREAKKTEGLARFAVEPAWVSYLEAETGSEPELIAFGEYKAAWRSVEQADATLAAAISAKREAKRGFELAREVMDFAWSSYLEAVQPSEHDEGCRFSGHDPVCTCNDDRLADAWAKAVEALRSFNKLLAKPHAPEWKRASFSLADESICPKGCDDPRCTRCYWQDPE